MRVTRAWNIFFLLYFIALKSVSKIREVSRLVSSVRNGTQLLLVSALSSMPGRVQGPLSVLDRYFSEHMYE